MLKEKIELSKEMAQNTKTKEEIARVKEKEAKAKEERFSIETCINLLNETGVDKNSVEYMTALELMTKPKTLILWIKKQRYKTLWILGWPKIWKHGDNSFTCL